MYVISSKISSIELYKLVRQPKRLDRITSKNKWPFSHSINMEYFVWPTKMRIYKRYNLISLCLLKRFVFGHGMCGWVSVISFFSLQSHHLNELEGMLFQQTIRMRSISNQICITMAVNKYVYFLLWFFYICIAMPLYYPINMPFTNHFRIYKICYFCCLLYHSQYITDSSFHSTF